MDIEEITTETLIEIGDQREAAYHIARSRLAVEDLKQRWTDSKDAVRTAQSRADDVETLCQMKALEMRRQGMPTAQVADWFRVTLSTVRRWYREPVRVALTVKGADR